MIYRLYLIRAPYPDHYESKRVTVVSDQGLRVGDEISLKSDTGAWVPWKYDLWTIQAMRINYPDEVSAIIRRET